MMGWTSAPSVNCLRHGIKSVIRETAAFNFETGLYKGFYFGMNCWKSDLHSKLTDLATDFASQVCVLPNVTTSASSTCNLYSTTISTLSQTKNNILLPSTCSVKFAVYRKKTPASTHIIKLVWFILVWLAIWSFTFTVRGARRNWGPWSNDRAYMHLLPWRNLDVTRDLTNQSHEGQFNNNAINGNQRVIITSSARKTIFKRKVFTQNSRSPSKHVFRSTLYTCSSVKVRRPSLLFRLPIINPIERDNNNKEEQL